MTEPSSDPVCPCGCGTVTGIRLTYEGRVVGKFVSGHDGMLYGDIIDAVDGLPRLKAIIEQHLGQPIQRVRRPQPTEDP